MASYWMSCPSGNLIIGLRNDANLTIDGRKFTGDVYVVVLEGNDGTSSGGWNLIGNPFDEDIALSNIEVFQE